MTAHELLERQLRASVTALAEPRETIRPGRRPRPPRRLMLIAAALVLLVSGAAVAAKIIDHRSPHHQAKDLTEQALSATAHLAACRPVGLRPAAISNATPSTRVTRVLPALATPPDLVAGQTDELGYHAVEDKVHVHDISHQQMRLLPGEVMIVQPKRDANSLAVRVTLPDGNTAVLRPEWLSVHLDPFDGTVLVVDSGNDRVQVFRRDGMVMAVTPVTAARGDGFLVAFEPGQKTFDNFMRLSFFLEDILGRPVDLVTEEALSPYIGPYIRNEAEYVPLNS